MALAWCARGRALTTAVEVAAREGREPATEGRWAGRPVLSAALVVFAHALPIAAAVATSAILSRQLTELRRRLIEQKTKPYRIGYAGDW